MEFSPLILTVFVLYFLVLIGIAVARARGMQEMSDYVLGGRRVGRITSALSAGSSVAEWLDYVGVSRPGIPARADSAVDAAGSCAR